MYLSSDTNIWIDLQIIEALELPFKLTHKFCISEETINDEMINPPGVDMRLVDLGLLLLKLTDEEYYYTEEILQKNPSLSTYDALALAIARIRGFVLLTGDRKLRIAASKENVEVRGTLWIIDELLIEKVIDEEQYLKFLKRLQYENGGRIRLPSIEIEIRLDRFK